VIKILEDIGELYEFAQGHAMKIAVGYYTNILMLSL